MTRMIRRTLASLAIGYAGFASAVSIYDVIELSRQDFSDNEVVNIIRTTGSAFELAAEDIPRLKKLGVSETVIQAMLLTTPDESTEGMPLPGTSEKIPAATEGKPVENSVRVTPVVSRNSPRKKSLDSDKPPLVMSRRFAVKFLSEDAAGGHQHAYVTLNGLPILILRDEGRYRSIEDRGKAVAGNLEKAINIGDGRFTRVHENGVEKIVYQGVDQRAVSILAINYRDVQAYDVRSERRLSSDLLAAYWAALLNDYWAIAVQHRVPTDLVNLHRGDALMLLYKIANQSGSGEQSDLGKAVQQLPGTIQRHLERLARSVPDDFDILPEHEEEAR
jgi:hypothetical protein